MSTKTDRPLEDWQPGPQGHPAEISTIRHSFQFGKNAFSQIPKEEIIAGGPPKDGIPALANPPVIPSNAAPWQPSQRVIGVELDGEARAYPLAVLNYHEIVNDQLAGQAIAVTYCPLCDSAVVFDRHIGGEIREFGVSGLLYNSNVLMYDRQETEAEESLWSQMLLAAVVGPAAERKLELELIPAQLTTWESWQQKHPQTTVLSPDTGHQRDYTRNPYHRYFLHQQLMFPVKPYQQEASDQHAFPPKEAVIIVKQNGTLKGYPVSRLKEAQDEKHAPVIDQFAGTELRFHPVDPERGVWEVTDGQGHPLPVAFSFWFKFRIAHPTVPVFGGP